jgi:hypothetical protein
VDLPEIVDSFRNLGLNHWAMRMCSKKANFYCLLSKFDQI